MLYVCVVFCDCACVFFGAVFSCLFHVVSCCCVRCAVSFKVPDLCVFVVTMLLCCVVCVVLCCCLMCWFSFLFISIVLCMRVCECVVCFVCFVWCCVVVYV